MRIFIITITILFVVSANAADHPVTDADMLAHVVTDSLDSLVAGDILPDARKVSVGFAAPGRWTRFAVQTVESALTTHGFAIADSAETAGWSLSFEAEEFRIVLDENGKSWERTVRAVFYYTVSDADGVILKSDRITASALDIVTGSPDDLNDAARFSPAVKRSVIREERNRLRIITFALFTGSILWFAFK